MKVYELAQNVSIPEHEIRWLVSAFFGCSLGEVALRQKETVSEELWHWLQRRARGEPVQYIAGFADFYGLRLFVDERVLIPRPETEQLVEHVLREHAAETQLTVVDVGTGSGAIALALKAQRPSWRVLASDVSEAALKVAKQNAESLGLELEFRRGNLLEPFTGEKIDIVVSNPPYLSESSDRVEPDVLAFEPSSALFPAERLGSSLADQGAWLADEMLAQFKDGSATRIYLELSERVARQLISARQDDFAELALWQDLNQQERFLLAGK